MIIRAFKSEDYEAVHTLLVKCQVEPPSEPSDLKGPCIVAEDEGTIVGVIWALVGTGTCAYVDFFTVDPKYLGVHLGWNLLKVMDNLLKELGVHRFMFHLEQDNTIFSRLVEKYQVEQRITRLRDLKWFRREIV